jgi:HSP20 family protein
VLKDRAVLGSLQSDGETMRYRRLHYRYSLMTRPDPLLALVEVWRGTGRTVMFGRGVWRPDADMCETAAGVEVTVDVAGVGDDDFEIQLFEDALVVEGVRQLPRCEEGGVYYAAGIRQGAFRLELPLPLPVDPERVEARYERGLLRISLPKPEAAR